MIRISTSIKTAFYVVVKDGLVCGDFFKFGIYAQSNNLKVVEAFMIWLEATSIEGEKEWLEDDAPDKCGLTEWLASDDPFKYNPAKCRRVADYLNTFAILPATARLQHFCMAKKTFGAIPYKLSEEGDADLDMAEPDKTVLK